MADQEIEKFDPSKLMDGVKDRIKATFVSLIPDAQWEQMCQVEMDKFFKPIQEKDFRGSNTGKILPSEFEILVLHLMKEQCTNFLKELFNKPEYQMTRIWNSVKGNDESHLSEHLDAMIKEKMPDMVMAMMTKFVADGFSMMFSNVQYQIQNQRY